MVASSSVSLIVSMYMRGGEPSIKRHVRNITPYASVGIRMQACMAGGENCVWARTIFERSGRKATLIVNEDSMILLSLGEPRYIDQRFAWNVAQHHFVDVCHVTLDTRPSLGFLSCK